MLTLFVCLAALAAAAPQSRPSTAHSTGPDSARAIVARSIDALGGDAALKRISALQIEAIGHDYFIDQSERPEGPFILRYVQTVEKRDVAGGRSRIESQQRFTQVPDWSGAGTATIADADAAVINRGERYGPAGKAAFDDARERVELAPERLLLVAQSATDLAAAPDAAVHGITQRVVTFTWRDRRARLLIDSGDFVPTALELSSEDTFGIWGTVKRTTYYSLWTLIAGGIRYPLQFDREWNGVAGGSTTIMKIAVNPTLDAAAFTIPDDAKKAFAAAPASGIPTLTLDPARRVDVATGIVQYSGNWNVAFVQQPDGIVVIEAPIGSRYSAQVLEEAAKRYAGAKVKAVITTSDAWPHLGGVREYAARGIPVYALDLNRPILERLLKADYGAKPDALATSPKAAKFTWISGKTTIGTGDTRMELYPIRGENGERMLMAYFPALKLLYTSDEIQPLRAGGFFMPELLLEVRDAIRREHLEVERIFGFHAAPTPWSEIEAAIAKASAGGS
jgi:hypothetical protein